MARYRFLTPEQIDKLEREYSERENLDVTELVRRVGQAFAQELFFFDYDFYRGPKSGQKRVTFVCGWGNNAADGWATATQLHKQYGIKTTVVTLVSPEELEGPVYELAHEAMRAGVNWVEVPLHDKTGLLAGVLEDADIVVDAILGRNCRLPLGPDLARVTAAINSSYKVLLSIDIPTGVCVRTGEVDPYAVKPVYTYSLFAAHYVLMQEHPLTSTYMFKVEDFGTQELQDTLFADAPKMYTNPSFMPMIPIPAFDANKYTRGRVLVIAGSQEYTGAAVLTTLAASTSGAGYVKLACPWSIVPIMQTHIVTAPVVGLPETASGGLSLDAFDELERLSEEADAVVIGPGLGRDPETLRLVQRFVAEATTPLVLDADALYAFNQNPEALERSRALITLTPHAGELARLVNASSQEVAQSPLEYAKKLVFENTVVLLKGPTSYLVNAEESSADLFAPPMLATAGSGDVLAGMIGAFMAQRLTPYFATALAVRLHGAAAKEAAEMLGPISVTALAVLNAIPAAVGLFMRGGRRVQ